ncbi:MAG: SusC/RagA family TonB-linked outer membrane protein [Prevotella sp.]|nr:SusC/RagA family TonB-linked outer membrane protein [Prevotella sp.]
MITSQSAVGTTRRKALFLVLLLCAGLTASAQTHYQKLAADSLGQGQRTTNQRVGSVDVVNEERMNKGLVTSSLEALSGQAAGVTVSSGADRMAMLSSVRVRGTTSLTGGNDPLVIIDGVYSDIPTLSGIYPADIENFTILKNAAETAPYGSRGASGVIVVTTKKGHGGQFHISYDGNMGFESVYKNLKMLRREEYIATAQRLGLPYVDGGFGTDFPKSVTRTGFVQNHHVAFSGGTEQSNYRASIGFMDHNTVIKVSEKQNFVAKLDLEQKAFDNLLTIDLGVFGSSQQNKYIFDDWKLFYSAASMNPTLSNQMNASGGWDRNANASQINPPAGLLREKDHEKNLNFNTHVGLDFDLLHQRKQETETASQPSLHLKLFGSYSYNSDENAQYLPTWVWAQGQAYRAEKKTEDWLGNISLHFENQWNVHHLALTALAEYQKSRRSGFWTTVKGFTTNDLGYDNLGAGATIPFGGTGSDYEDPSLASFMAMAEYRLMDKYTLTASLRTDGSSMVGKNHRWGVFPSVSGTWDILKEFGARNPLPFLTMLKLRMGYGLSGNLGGIESYNSLTLLHPNGLVPWNGSNSVSFGSLKNVNPDLKWETRGTFNVGVDLGLWQNRFVMTAEYYYSKTWDMLYEYDVPVPPFTYNTWVANLGEMSNSGFELGFGVTPIQKKDMELNINVNVSFQKNKLISLSGNYNGTYMAASDLSAIGGLNGAGFHGGNNNIVYQIIGQPLGVFYLPHCTGLVQNSDGTYSYGIEDIDGSGDINIEDGGDRYIAGQATPKMMLGSNVSFRYKAFDVSLQMNGAFGHKIYNGTALTYMNMGSFPDYNVMRGAPEASIYDQTATDYWLERGDYLNFDYLTVGWNVPLRKTRYVSSLRLSASVNNLATITSYSGLTPMINSSAVNSTLGIDDKRSYPPYRSYSIGVSIQF